MAEPYQSFIQLTSVVDLNLQLMPFSCMTGRAWNHWHSLIIVTTSPVALLRHTYLPLAARQPS